MYVDQLDLHTGGVGHVMYVPLSHILSIIVISLFNRVIDSLSLPLLRKSGPNPGSIPYQCDVQE